MAPANSQKYTFKSASDAWTLVRNWLPNPDIVLQRRGQRITIYKELLSDAHIEAVLSSRAAVPTGHDWELLENDCPKRVFKAIEDWFYGILERRSSQNDLSRDDLICNLMDAVWWGYLPAELVWDLVGGFWLPIQIIPKPVEWFGYFIPEGGSPELRFLSVAHPIDGEPPPDEFTLICPRIKPTYDNPYGNGVAGKCFWPVVFKRGGMEFWLNFMERFAIPWVIGKSGTTDETKNREFRNDLARLVQDAVVVVSGVDKTIELLESRSAKESGFDLLCNFMDSQVSKAVLGHSLSTDTAGKGGGSYAATRGALTVRDDIGVKDTKMIKGVFNDIIHLIMNRNGYYTQPRPTANPYHESEVELERAQRDEALNRQGVRFSKEYYERTYGFQKGDIDEVKDPQVVAQEIANNQIQARQVTSIKTPKETSTTPGGLDQDRDE